MERGTGRWAATVSIVLAAPAMGQGRIEAQAALAPTLDLTRVIYDEIGDGSVWAAGATYKASFAADGVTYIPYLGPEAPRNYPVTFALESASLGGVALDLDLNAVPVHAGDEVRFERGSLVELYAITPTSIEQRFVLDRLPAAGELVLRVRVESELALSESAEGFDLANELGAVRYGRAEVLDARGLRAPAATSSTAAGIEIRVPADFLQRARLPVTIDPLITTFGVSATTVFDDFSPDVAYDLTNDVFLAVWERTFSGSDHDAYSQLHTTSGYLVAGSQTAIDITGAYWAGPRCANNNAGNQFLVVGAVGQPSSGARLILARTRDAASTAMGFPVTVSSATGDEILPDVGGDPYALPPSYYCVVWEHFVPSSEGDIRARLVATDSSFASGILLVDGTLGTLDQRPAVSKGNAGTDWTVVWQRQVTPTNLDIHGARIHWNGASSSASFLIDGSSANDVAPSVSTPLDAPSNRVLVAFQRDFGTHHDIEGVVLNGSSVVTAANISVLEATAQLKDQIAPSAESDGCKFVVAYSELEAGSNSYDVFAATFDLVGTSLLLSEAHELLDLLTPGPEFFVQLASIRSAGGNGPRFMGIWEDHYFVTLGEVFGGIYDAMIIADFCHPGVGGVIPCPCGNPPFLNPPGGCNNSANTGGAFLNPGGMPSLSGDTIILNCLAANPGATLIFVQGDAVVPAGSVFGQGVRCVGGSLKRLYIRTGGALSAPTGADPSVSARSAALGDPIPACGTRFYYVYYRDPIVLGGCPATSTFNTTQAIRMVWYP